MIRSELLQLLAKDNPDLRAEDVERALDTFFDEIAARLAAAAAASTEAEIVCESVPSQRSSSAR